MGEKSTVTANVADLLKDWQQEGLDGQGTDPEQQVTEQPEDDAYQGGIMGLTAEEWEKQRKEHQDAMESDWTKGIGNKKTDNNQG